MSVGCLTDQFFCFVHIQLQIVASAPLNEMRDGVLEVCNRVIVMRIAVSSEYLKYVMLVAKGLIQSFGYNVHPLSPSWPCRRTDNPEIFILRQKI